MKDNKTFSSKKQIAAQYNLIDDELFYKLCQNSEACEEMIRTILGRPSLRVVKAIPQMTLRNIDKRGVILDLLCETESGELINVEVQKTYNDDEVRRMRYNQSNIDIYSAKKGILFKELPEIFLIFIGQFDIFNAGKMMYHIDRIIRETGTLADNGVHELYLNTTCHDGSDIGELLKLFIDSSKINDKFPKISAVAQYYRNDPKGVEIMCDATEKAEKRGAREAARKIAANMLKSGYSVEEIVRITKCTKKTVLKIEASL